jgi:hypothetical protein
MLGPVISSMRRWAARRVSLAMKLSTWRSTTGWRPASISITASSTNSGCAVVVQDCGGGKGGQAVEFGDGAGDFLQLRDMRCERAQQFFPELPFQRQSAFVGGQRLVLEGLELRSDVALGVLQGLPAAVVVGDLVHVGVGDLDVEAMHLVEFDLEAGDAAAFALAGFELDQEGAAVVLDRAQFVEVGAVARRDHAAFAQQRAWLGGDGIREQRDAGERCGQRREQFGEPGRRSLAADYWAHLSEPRKAVAQRGKVARAGIFQRDAGGDALDVGEATKAPWPVPPPGRCRLLRSGRRRPRGVRAECAVGRGMVQAVAQPARAHAGGAGVEQRKQGGRRLAAQGFRDFKIAPGRGIQAQVAAFVFDTNWVTWDRAWNCVAWA